MRQSNTMRNRKESITKDLKFNYDPLNDLLYVYKENSSVYSNVMIGEFHLDFNKKSELVGIEIVNASQILGEYDIPEEFLESIKKIDVKVVTRGNSILIFMMISSLSQTKSATITLNNLEAPIMAEIAKA